MRTRAHTQLCLRLWVGHVVCCQFPLPMLQSPNLLHLRLECSVFTNGPGTLMSSTPHSINTVSQEQPRSTVCNGELESLSVLHIETMYSFLPASVTGCLSSCTCM